MLQRSPSASVAFSVNPSCGQTLILIASDGVRVSVNRAVATEASYVLRDLLDGQDLVSSPVSNQEGLPGGFLSEAEERTPPRPAATGAPMAVQDLENLFEDPVPSPTASQSASGGGGKTAVPDLMDFFSVAPSQAATTTAKAATSTTAAAPVAVWDNAVAASAASATTPGAATAAGGDDFMTSLWGPQPHAVQPASTPTKDAARTSTSTTHVRSLAPLQPPSPGPPPPPPPPAEVELAFPYFTGDILERVCRHMSYRFRMSSFGTEDGCYRVYLVKTRNIPRPMTLPMLEYLDMKDRRFISDWDEMITVQMVKAATLLNYEELLQLASAKLASYLIERDLEGVRTFLGVEGDFDAVEEAELKKEQATDYNR